MVDLAPSALSARVLGVGCWAGGVAKPNTQHPTPKTLLGNALGVDIGTCSSLHVAEDVRLPEAIRAYFQVPEEIRRDYDPQEWSIGYGGTPESSWDKVWAEADRCRWIEHQHIGAALCHLFKTRAVVNLMRDWRLNDPFWLFGVAKDRT